MSGDRKTFRPAVKITATLLALVVAFAAAEVLLHFVPAFTASLTPAYPAPDIKGLYSEQELRTDLPRFTERQGGACIEIRRGFHWDPRFGFASKKLDKECAKRLFAAHQKSVVLLGGSAMEDVQAPNYLTSIDTYAFGDDKSFASLNLAESGARHSNMLSRFLYEVVELHPTYVVFLDGFNEFNSVRYGGEPDDDFYWTAGVKDRVHHPLLFLRDKLVESSRVLQLLAVSTGFVSSARIVRDKIDLRLVARAADYYVRTRGYTEAICKAYAITCIFILQPVSLLEKSPAKAVAQINRADLARFPFDAEVYRTGYDEIRRKAGDKVVDASRLFEGHELPYFDVVHFNKRGSKLVGDYIRSMLK